MKSVKIWMNQRRVTKEEYEIYEKEQEVNDERFDENLDWREIWRDDWDEHKEALSGVERSTALRKRK